VIDRLKWNVIFQFNMQVWYDMMFFSDFFITTFSSI